MRHDALRLAGMMFLQYGGLGAWIVPLAHWLRSNPAAGGLGFSPSDIGAIYSTLALGGLIAPMFTGLLADRTFASEKIIGFANALMALLMLAAGLWGREFSGADADPVAAFLPLFFILLAYSILVMTAITTGAAMTLRSLSDPTRQFGRVRLVGTFGWVITVAFIGLALNPISAAPFYVAALCHGVLAFTFRLLPHTPPLGRGRPLAEVIGLPALKLFRDPSFIVFVVVAFTAHVMQSFYSVFANVYCHDLGMWKPEFVMTSSQWVEMGCLALIPLMIRTVGLKWTLACGIAAWALRSAILTGENLYWIAWLGVPLQGVAYTWYTIVGSLYIDREAPPHLRAGAQGLLLFVSSGPGTLLGNTIAGSVVASYTLNGKTDWASVWLVPTIGCTLAAVVFVTLFREPRESSSPLPSGERGRG